MSGPCLDFRARLARALAGPVDPAELSALGWHEHLLGCLDCRDLLEAEEALEALLASLPEPKLPPDLAAKVLARLASDPLDALLDLGAAPDAPTGLAARVLAATRDRQDAALDALLDRADVAVPRDLAPRVLSGVAARRDEALERLLDRAGTVRVPSDLDARVLAGVERTAALDRLLDRAGAVEVPSGLTDRVLARVGAGRARERRAAFRLVRPGFARKAAAVLLVGAGLAFTWRVSGVGEPREVPLPADDLLACFDVLEHWELLEQLDPVALDALSLLDEGDELLIELAEGR